MKNIIKEIIENKFNSKNQWVLVIGDLMLDKYIFGEVKRISPEAPVPVLKKESESFRMGGAANVAANLNGLGIKTSLCGAVGNDLNGQILRDLLKENKILQQGLIKTKLPTSTKTRIIGGQQQIVRIDDEDLNLLLPANEMKKIINLIKKKPSVIILSDYAKGFLSPELTQKIIKLANQLKITTLVDPKGNDIEKYRGSSILTPNKKEALILTNTTLNDEALLEKELKKICLKLNIKNIAMTQGEQGIKLISSRKIEVLPTNKTKKVFDVSGAGDTVIATLAAGLIGKLNINQSLELANIAAGIVIGKIGTVPINKNEMMDEVDKKPSSQKYKIMTINELVMHLKRIRSKKNTIGFTNGCFDILHAGHVSYLEKAKDNIDYLILGLNSDNSVKKLKGTNRPVINAEDRARILSSLEVIDAIIIFNEETPLNLIKKIKPDFLIKGNDYKVNEVVGYSEIKNWGGEVKLIELLEGRSSSKIIKKIH